MLKAMLAKIEPRWGWAEAFDNSRCALEIDMLRWRLRFSVGLDRADSCCELVWAYIDLGPVHLSLAIGH